MKVISPLTKEQVKLIQDEDGYIAVEISVDLDDLIDLNLEGLNDLAEELILKDGILSDISYKVVGHQTPAEGTGSVIIQVTAEVYQFDDWMNG